MILISTDIRSSLSKSSSSPLDRWHGSLLGICWTCPAARGLRFPSYGTRCQKYKWLIDGKRCFRPITVHFDMFSPSKNCPIVFLLRFKSILKIIAGSSFSFLYVIRLELSRDVYTGHSVSPGLAEQNTQCVFYRNH